MNRDTPWQLVHLDATHSSEIRALFGQIFGHPMSEALWNWKYGNYRGLGTGTRDRSGRLLAHYGGTVRTLWVQGQPLAAVQLGDVMVAPDARGFLSRNGPFSVATQGFLQQHIGLEQPFAFGFGFPNERAAKLGQILGLYTTTNEVQELLWPQAPQPNLWQRLRWQITPIDWAAAPTVKHLNQLWQAMQSQTTGFVIGQRDALWWQHRFANHPETHYRCFWLRQRLNGRIVGVLALKPGQGAGQPWELLDWMAPLPQTTIMVQAARAIAAQAGSAALQGWFSSPVADLLRQQPALNRGSTQHACTACVTIRQRAGLPDLTSLPWWLTGGDTDFR